MVPMPTQIVDDNMLQRRRKVVNTAHRSTDNPILQENTPLNEWGPSKRVNTIHHRPDQVGSMGAHLQGPEDGLWGPGTKIQSKKACPALPHNIGMEPTVMRVMHLGDTGSRQDKHGVAAREVMPGGKARVGTAHRDSVGALINYRFAGAMHDPNWGEMKAHTQEAKDHERAVHAHHEHLAQSPDMQPQHVLRSDVTEVFAATTQGPRPLEQRSIW